MVTEYYEVSSDVKCLRHSDKEDLKLSFKVFVEGSKKYICVEGSTENIATWKGYVEKIGGVTITKIKDADFSTKENQFLIDGLLADIDGMIGQITYAQNKLADLGFKGITRLEL